MGCLFHNWYYGQFITGFKSEYTGDHVGRSERHCLHCDRLQISLSQYSEDKQISLRLLARVSKKAKYITYTRGDKVDILTKKWIEDSGAIRL